MSVSNIDSDFEWFVFYIILAQNPNVSSKSVQKLLKLQGGVKGITEKSSFWPCSNSIRDYVPCRSSALYW